MWLDDCNLRTPAKWCTNFGMPNLILWPHPPGEGGRDHEIIKSDAFFELGHTTNIQLKVTNGTKIPLICIHSIAFHCCELLKLPMASEEGRVLDSVPASHDRTMEMLNNYSLEGTIRNVVCAAVHCCCLSQWNAAMQIATTQFTADVTRCLCLTSSRLSSWSIQHQKIHSLSAQRHAATKCRRYFVNNPCTSHGTRMVAKGQMTLWIPLPFCLSGPQLNPTTCVSKEQTTE